MRYFLALLFCLSACARHHAETKPASDSRRGELQGLVAQKLQELAGQSDLTTGWPSVRDCDAALWAGEALAAGAKPALSLAEWQPGEIHRRPLASGECYPAESVSTVSKDMLLGYVYGSWAAGDLAALQRLADYGAAHEWVMGQPFPSEASRVVMAPDGAGLLGRAIEALSKGADKRLYREVPLACLTVSSDYEYHLQTLAILLDGEVADRLEGEALLDITTPCHDRLMANAAAFPKDALIQAAAGVYTGDFSAAYSLLLDPGYQAPSYVRGAPSYGTVHWLFAAHTVLKHEKDGT